MTNSNGTVLPAVRHVVMETPSERDHRVAGGAEHYHNGDVIGNRFRPGIDDVIDGDDGHMQCEHNSLLMTSNAVDAKRRFYTADYETV
jgi:hypothetical protein